MNRKFYISAILTSILGIILILGSLIIGKNECFLLLNTDLGRTGDFIFQYATYLGDGVIWVPVSVLVLLYKRDNWILLLSSIIISTAIVNICKHLFFAGTPRPFTTITDHAKIHTVPGVDIHSFDSFPSGHTTTAFTIYLLGALLIGNRAWLIIGFLLALAAGYSRVYLAQHFPLDVGAGMITAIIAVVLSYYLQKRFKLKIED